MSPVHQVRPKPSCRAQWKGEEDKGRSRKTTSGNGQAWSSPRPRRQWRTGENGGRLLQNHLWCPSRLRYKWDDMRNWHIFAFFFLCKQFTNCSQTFHEVKKKNCRAGWAFLFSEAFRTSQVASWLASHVTSFLHLWLTRHVGRLQFHSKGRAHLVWEFMTFNWCIWQANRLHIML